MTNTSFYKTICNLIRKNKLLLPGIIIIFVLICALILQAGYGYHISLQEDLRVKTELYSMSSAMLVDTEQLEEGLEFTKRRVDSLERGLINEQKVPVAAAKIQKEIEGLTKKRGIVVTSTKTLPSKDKDEYLRIPVQFQFETKLQSLTELLHDIQSSQAVLSVKNIHVRNVKTKNNGRLNVTILVEGLMKK